MPYLVYDLETIPDGRSLQQDYHPEAETPDQAIDLYQQQAARGFVPHTYQQPIAIGLLMLDDGYRPERLNLAYLRPPASDLRLPSFGRGYQTLEQLVAGFWRLWQKRCRTFITFNGRAFDQALMELLAFAQGLDVPEWFDQDHGPSYRNPRNRYCRDLHIDLYDEFTNFGRGTVAGGLNRLARMCGGVGKLEISGSDVRQLYADRRMDLIGAYALMDVADTAICFWRTCCGRGQMTVQDFELRREELRALLQDLDGQAFGPYIQRLPHPAPAGERPQPSGEG